jgi:hypothetical protein
VHTYECSVAVAAAMVLSSGLLVGTWGGGEGVKGAREGRAAERAGRAAAPDEEGSLSCMATAGPSAMRKGASAVWRQRVPARVVPASAPHGPGLHAALHSWLATVLLQAHAAAKDAGARCC